MQAASSGYFHSMMLDSNGIVWASGANAVGQLGLGDKVDRQTPVALECNEQKFVGVYCGGNYSCLLTDEGRVFCCGSNKGGQLGLSNRKGFSSLQQSPELPPIKAIAPYYDPTILLDTESNVYSSGYNHFGQLGHGDSTNRLKFEKIEDLAGISHIANGLSHSLFLRDDGIVLGCGSNRKGEVAGGSTAKMAIPTRLPGLPCVVSISAGRDHSLFLDKQGTVWGCGSNDEGQLGPQTTDNSLRCLSDSLLPIVSIFAKHKKSFLIDCEGTVWASGMNSNCELGIGVDVEKSPTAFTKVDGMPPITDIISGSNHTFFFSNNGELYVAGSTENGALGLDTKTIISTPKRVEFNSSVEHSWPEVPFVRKSFQKSARKV